MVGGEQAFATACHVLSSSDGVPQSLKARLDDLPSASLVMPLEVPHVLQNDEAGPMHFQNLVKQRPGGRVAHASLSARLREWLARKAGAKHVVRGDFVLGESDIAVCRWPSRKVLVVDLAELVIDLGREDALVAEALECEAEPPEASEEVDELHPRQDEADVVRGRRIGLPSTCV